MTLLALYKEQVIAEQFEEDPLQIKAISLLSALQTTLEQKKTFLCSLFNSKDKVKGLYLYGGVGRGKSFVMDLFFDHVAIEKKKRLHFHEFMRMVHDYIHANREHITLDKALPEFAKDFKKQAHLLCFDEFHVTDIADAMILGRLFEHLWAQGIVIVITSNWEPKTLYKDGLQRDLFLPFIQKLYDKMDVFHLDSEKDYRLEKLKGVPLYFSPVDKTKMDMIFETLTKDTYVTDHTLKVKGHDFYIPQHSLGRVARFDYEDILTKDYAALDFLSLSDVYETVMIDNLPVWSKDYKNEVKRFMILVDALYDKGRKLILSAEVEMSKLYIEGPLSFEFERTLSRLQEMQSLSYDERSKERYA